MIKLVVLDVDGCLTDGRIIYSEDGNETKSFNVKDGLAIRSWLRMGKEAAIITGRQSLIVKRRAEELGIAHLFQRVGDKASTLRKLAQSLDIELSEIAAIGDDLNDYKMLGIVGHSFAPANASGYLLDSVDTVLASRGGEGAVREMLERVIRDNGEEEAFLALWQ